MVFTLQTLGNMMTFHLIKYAQSCSINMKKQHFCSQTWISRASLHSSKQSVAKCMVNFALVNQPHTFHYLKTDVPICCGGSSPHTRLTFTAAAPSFPFFFYCPFLDYGSDSQTSIKKKPFSIFNSVLLYKICYATSKITVFFLLKKKEYEGNAVSLSPIVVSCFNIGYHVEVQEFIFTENMQMSSQFKAPLNPKIKMLYFVPVSAFFSQCTNSCLPRPCCLLYLRTDNQPLHVSPVFPDIYPLAWSPH